MLSIRIPASILMICIVLGAFYLDRNIFETDLSIAILLSMLVGIGLLEFYNLAEKKGLKPAKFTGIIAGILLVLLTYAQLNWGHPNLYWFNEFSPSWMGLSKLALVMAIFAAFFAESRSRDIALSVENISVTVFGLMYVWFLSSFLLALRHLGGAQGQLYLNADNWLEYGQYCLLTCIMVTKSGDIGAYTFGRLFGSVKLAPKISPGKTIEGAFGALITSTGVSMALSYSAWGVLKPMQALAFGIIVSFAGLCGDLAESMFKRSAGVKDSGSVPGFGGVLDILDALLVSAPVAYYMLVYMSPQIYLT